MWQSVAEDSSTVGHVKVWALAFENALFQGRHDQRPIERKGDGVDDDDEE